jgi:hypothetical protein
MLIKPDALLSRVETANALTELGFKIAPTTLTTLACRGGGPPYKVFARRPLYKWADALTWAKSKLSDPTPSNRASVRGEDQKRAQRVGAVR